MSLDILILAIFRLKFLHPHLNFKFADFATKQVANAYLR